LGGFRPDFVLKALSLCVHGSRYRFVTGRRRNLQGALAKAYAWQRLYSARSTTRSTSATVARSKMTYLTTGRPGLQQRPLWIDLGAVDRIQGLCKGVRRLQSRVYSDDPALVITAA